MTFLCFITEDEEEKVEEEVEEEEVEELKEEEKEKRGMGKGRRRRLNRLWVDSVRHCDFLYIFNKPLTYIFIIKMV